MVDAVVTRVVDGRGRRIASALVVMSIIYIAGMPLLWLWTSDGNESHQRGAEVAGLPDEASSIRHAAELAGVSNDGIMQAGNDDASKSALQLSDALNRGGVRFALTSKDAFEGTMDSSPLPAIVRYKGDGTWSSVLGWSQLEDSAAVMSNDGVVRWTATSSLLSKLDDEILVAEKRAPVDRAGAEVWVPGGRIVLDGGNGQAKIKRTATLFNRGSRLLKIENVAFSCACTKGRLNSPMIVPGGYTKLELEIDITGIRAIGFAVDAIISIEGSAAQTIPIRVAIENPVRFSPDYFELGAISADTPVKELTTKLIVPERYRKTVRIEPVHLDGGLKLLEIDTTSGVFRIRMNVSATEAKRDASGFFKSDAMFAIDGAGERQLIAIGAVGRLEPWIQVRPPIVNVGSVVPGEEVVRKVRFKSVAKGNAAISCVHPEYCQASVVDDLVDIKFIVPTAPSVFRTGVLLRIGTESVVIPVIGSLRAPLAPADIKVDQRANPSTEHSAS